MKDIKQALEEINTRRAYPITLTNNKIIKFKPITIEQLQGMIASVTKNPYLNIGFQQELTNLIRINSIADFDINTINELDKVIIALQSRIVDISSTWEGTPIMYNIPQLQEDLDIVIGDVKVTCSIPDLYTEERYNNFTIEKYGEPASEENALKDILNIMFAAELGKYVKSVTVSGTEYNSKDSFAAWTTAVSALSTDYLKEVLKYVDNTKVLRDNMLRIDDNTAVQYDIRIFTDY
jgi:hypothetical protein